MTNKKSYRELSKPSYWDALVPDLTVSDRPLCDVGPSYSARQGIAETAGRQIQDMGYFAVEPIVPDADRQKLLGAIDAIIDAGLPPTFVFMYDEAWRVLSGLAGTMESIVGSPVAIAPDIAVWKVGADSSLKGASPHRDNNLNLAEIQRPDGMPNVFTAWVALTDATTENSCVYVLPTPYDPGDLAAEHIPFSALHHVQALPARAGALLGWTKSTLHWGCGHMHQDAPERISIVVDIQRTDYAGYPVPSVKFSEPLPFTTRLAVVCRAVHLYRKRGEYDPALIAFCKGCRLLYEMTGKP